MAKMKLHSVFKAESSKISWIVPALLFGIYAVMDWSVASAGGNSLLGLIIPVQQVLMLLFAAGLLAFGAVGLYLLINRQFVKCIVFLFFIAYFSVEVTRDRD